ncbi:TPA: hypothetical protein ACKQCQ_001076 [Serratia marcescens]
MDNKLSELSKPVAYSLRFRNMNGEPDKTINANTTFSTLEKAKAYGLGSRYVTQDDGKIVSVRDPSQDPIVEPLYSQEYVSALDGVAQFWIGESAGWKKRAEDAERRIAELERARFIAWPGAMFAPVLARIKVDVKHRDGSLSVGKSAGNVVWYHSDSPSDVVAFALAVEGDE